MLEAWDSPGETPPATRGRQILREVCDVRTVGFFERKPHLTCQCKTATLMPGFLEKMFFNKMPVGFSAQLFVPPLALNLWRGFPKKPKKPSNFPPRLPICSA